MTVGLQSVQLYITLNLDWKTCLRNSGANLPLLATPEVGQANPDPFQEPN